MTQQAVQGVERGTRTEANAKANEASKIFLKAGVRFSKSLMPYKGASPHPRRHRNNNGHEAIVLYLLLCASTISGPFPVLFHLIFMTTLISLALSGKQRLLGTAHSRRPPAPWAVQVRWGRRLGRGRPAGRGAEARAKAAEWEGRGQLLGDK